MKEFSIRILLIRILCFVLLIFVSGCLTGRSTAVNSDLSGSDTTIYSVGEIVEVNLSANPSTGYTWIVDENYDRRVIEFISKVYIPHQPPDSEPIKTGSGGVEVITFKVIGKGQTKINLTYNRRWATGNSEDSNLMKSTIIVKAKN